MVFKNEKLTCLVTGATGLVGSHIAEFLISRGHRVKAIVRPSGDTRFLESLGVECVQGDLTIPLSVDSAVEGIDIVFHCAAMVSDWADRDTMYKINVGGTQNVIDACLKHKVKRMVMVSSLAVLGMGRQVNADESAPYVYTGDNYNYTKIESEKIVIAAIKDNGLPAVIVRPPYIYGPRDRQLLPRVVEFLKEGKFVFIGSGENPISLVYVKNLVQAVYRCAINDNAVGGIYHITDGKDVTRKEFISMLANKLGYPIPNKSVPVQVARIACPVLEFINKITKSKNPPLLNKFRMKFLDTYLTFDIERAKKEIGYKPEYTLEMGIEETVKWFQSKEKVFAGVS